MPTAPMVAALISTFMSRCRALKPATAARKIGSPPTTMAARYTPARTTGGTPATESARPSMNSRAEANVSSALGVRQKGVLSASPVLATP